MSAPAIEEARRFLNLHPWSTTDIDNPVDLLEAVVADYAKLEEECAQLVEDEAPTDRLLVFIRRLRDDRKISEAEYQTAVHLAE